MATASSISAASAALTGLRRTRARAARRRAIALIVLVALTAALFVIDLAYGRKFYALDDVARVVMGQDVPGATFIIGELRLPRVIVGTLCGLAFGMAGVCFQQMLRNTMASPDIIGITSGANLAAVVGIILLKWSGLPLSALAMAGGLITALVTSGLSWKGTIAPSRLILMGIGLSAALNAATSWVLIRGDQWDIQAASRWLTGSLASSDWTDVPQLAAILIVTAVPLMLLVGQIDVLRLGDPMARSLGVRTNAVQTAVIVLAVLLLSSATAASGPIAFVAFLSGPIASWAAGPSKPPLAASGLVGASIVLLSDIVAQHIPPTQLPVGVVTSVIGGPVLIILLIRLSRKQTLI
ncbi:FecCD family ABC transporter permease [Bifidobacterium vespertilionis]|uniref:Iron ABC transporter permease n=1 Tax=Bifidobacterium vespertilionis TaxID=2562524 RepID=A0A5J5DST1_9BIFI|nr:iron ABC transporter permease [Bifidobacterium vespertilionis]KAA8816992.1 iron ABC transporter permease [Bifidobacterium vespertilionis]KAA8823764.1 iron ABC transporter permease [Bifidobacterium vespertilionis]